jgi:hypothetical protein
MERVEGQTGCLTIFMQLLQGTHKNEAKQRATHAGIVGILTADVHVSAVLS